jgi:hypothetical protein
LNSWGFLIHRLKFVWGMLLWAVFLLLSPLLLIIPLVSGTRFMSPDEIGLMKVLLVVVGPFAFTFWWITISHFSRRYRVKRLIALRSEMGDDYTDEEIRFLERVGKPRHLRNLGVLVPRLLRRCIALIFSTMLATSNLSLGYLGEFSSRL